MPSRVASQIARAADPAYPDLAQPMFDVETRAQAGAASETFVTVVVTLGALALVESALVRRPRSRSASGVDNASSACWVPLA